MEGFKVINGSREKCTRTGWGLKHTEQACLRFPFYLFLYLSSAVGIVKMMKQHCKTWKLSHWCVSVSIGVINFGRLVTVLIECLCLGVGPTVGLSYILFSSVVLVCGSCRPADVCGGINIVGDIDLGACTQSYIQLSCGGLPITISQRLSGSTRGGASTHQEAVL